MSILSRLISAAVAKPCAFCARSAERACDGSGAPAFNGSGAPALRGSGAPALSGSGAPALSGSGAPAYRRAARRWCGLGVALACATATSLLLTASPAFASVGHNYLCQITNTTPGSSTECNSGGSGTAGFSNPSGLTISNGNLWVTSPGQPAAYEFNSSGNLVETIPGSGSGYSFGGLTRSVAVDNTSGTVYLADSGPDNVKVFSSSGAFTTLWTGSTTPSGSFGGGYISVAVDNSTGGSADDVYVSDSTHQLIDKLDASGNPVNFSGSASYISGSQITGTPSGSFSLNSTSSDALTTDSNGNIYIADNGNNVVDEFAPSGTFVQSFTGTGTPTGSFGSIYAVAVDSSGNVYVDDTGNDAVDEFSSTGTFIGQVTGGATPAGSFSPSGVAVDSSGDPYVSDSAHNVVDKFGPSVQLATPTTSPATNITDTGATLNGSVDPANGGNVTACQFEYGTSPSLGSTAACSPAAPFSSVTAVSAALTGLTPDTTYFFRVDGTDAQGTAVGSTLSFTTTGPPTVDGESTSNVGATDATLQAQINPHGHDTTYQFEYGTTTSYGTTVPATAADIGSGTSDVSVSQAITGLTAGTTYHFRVVATSTDNTSTVVDGSDETFTTSPPVSISSESVTNVTDTSATLQSQIDPDGSDTTYQFQYGTTTSYGQTAPATPADIGSGTSFVPANAALSGLAPNTTYHFRVVATNAATPAGGVDGADHTFTTYASNLPSGLPDGRAYELVTPANTDNLSPYVRNGPIGFEASTDGNAMAYLALETLPNSQSYGASYLATRGSGGWTSADMMPPQSNVTGTLCSIDSGIVGYASDMSKAILEDGAFSSSGCPEDDPPLVSGEPRGVQNVFVEDPATGSYQLVDVTPSGVTPSDATFDGASSDLNHVVFDESAPLTSNAPSGDDLYEWTAGTTPSNGAVSLVTQVPATGSTSCTGSACTPVSGSLVGSGLADALHAVSSDGSRVVFTANGNLYVRENGTTTVQVDAPASGAAGPGGGGSFAAASADGSEVFFTDAASAGLTSGTVSGSGTNLYEYDVSTGALTDLTAASTAQVQGVSAVSDDGSYVYFVADGSLSSGATAGQPNLYVWHNGTTTFIDSLSGSDSNDWSSFTTARVSSNGSYFVFNSVQSLTGFNNTDANSGNPDDEIFLYNASANQVSCVSCNPSGAAPTGGAAINSPEEAGVTGNQEFLQRYVSDTGQVFFDTSDELLPADTNGLLNVYEYEGGQLRLVSSGTSDANSYYVDSTPDGSNLFFTSDQQLVPQDADNGFDIYDARVGGGFAFSPPAPACQGDSCKPPETPAPAAPAAASISFSGPGNTAAPTVGKAHILSRSASGTTIKLQVTVPAAGLLVVSGSYVTKVTRGVGAAGTYTITLHLTKAAKNRLKHMRRLKASKRKLSFTVTVRYASVTGSSSSGHVKLTVKA